MAQPLRCWGAFYKSCNAFWLRVLSWEQPLQSGPCLSLTPSGLLPLCSWLCLPKCSQGSLEFWESKIRSSFLVSAEFSTDIEQHGSYYIKEERKQEARIEKQTNNKWNRFSIDSFIHSDLFNSIVRVTVHKTNSTGKVKSVDAEQE